MQITKSTVLVLLATATAVNAFTVAPFAQSATRAMMAPKAPVVFMADDTATAEAGSGVQDDEYTVLDDKGNPIELTLQEKERIFLDALQVSDERDVLSDPAQLLLSSFSCVYVCGCLCVHMYRFLLLTFTQTPSLPPSLTYTHTLVQMNICTSISTTVLLCHWPSTPPGRRV